MNFNDIILNSMNHDEKIEQKNNTNSSTSMPAVTSTAEKRRTIYRNINKLSVADKQDVLAVIVTKGLTAMIKSCSEGIVINLNNIDIDTINQMYYMLDYKLNI